MLSLYVGVKVEVNLGPLVVDYGGVGKRDRESVSVWRPAGEGRGEMEFTGVYKNSSFPITLIISFSMPA